MALGNTLPISAPDIDQAIADGYTVVRVYSSATRDGSYSLLGTVTLVADDTAYTYSDTTGTATTWYRTAYYGATPGEATQSEPFPAYGATVYTLLQMVRDVTSFMGLRARVPGDYTQIGTVATGASGVTTSSGTSSTVVCTSYADSMFVNSDSFRGWFLRFANGSISGEERRLTGLTNNSTGTFTAARAFSASTPNSAAFDVWGKQPYQHWVEVINDATMDVPMPFYYALTGVTSQTEYVLPAAFQTESQVTRLIRRTGDDANEHMLYPGEGFETYPLEGGGVKLYRPTGFPNNSVYLVQGVRYPPKMFQSTDTVPLSDVAHRAWVAAAAAQAAERFEAAPAGGLLEDYRTWSVRKNLYKKRHIEAMAEMQPWTPTRSALRRRMVAV